MGKPKLFLPMRGKPVLQWVLESVLATKVSELICVVRDLTAVRANISVADHRVSWLVNYGSDAGQSSSIIAGLWAIDPQSDAALFVAGDQPMFSNELVNAIIDRCKRVSAPIIALSFQGQVRNPALFRREMFPELLKLRDDHDGRAVINEHKEQLELVHWNDAGAFVDIDDEEDYETVKSLA
jgi:molybdenum cofactor cytidylyltransferase